MDEKEPPIGIPINKDIDRGYQKISSRAIVGGGKSSKRHENSGRRPTKEDIHNKDRIQKWVRTISQSSTTLEFEDWEPSPDHGQRDFQGKLYYQRRQRNEHPKGWTNIGSTSKDFTNLKKMSMGNTD